MKLPPPEPATGKSGEPLPQVAGIPFPVIVRACNANFEPVPTDRVVVRLATTDRYRHHSGCRAHADGELVTELTFNSSGTFTVEAEDITGPEYYTVISPEVAVSGSTGIVSAWPSTPSASSRPPVRP